MSDNDLRVSRLLYVARALGMPQGDVPTEKFREQASDEIGAARSEGYHTGAFNGRRIIESALRLVTEEVITGCDCEDSCARCARMLAIADCLRDLPPREKAKTEGSEVTK